MKSGFELLSMETASEAALPFMDAAKDKFGFVPNLLKALAEAPVALETYLTVTKLLGKSSLSQLEQHTVMMAASAANDCHYCKPAHAVPLSEAGMSDVDLDAVKSGNNLSDDKLNALQRFTTAVVEKRGQVPEDEVQSFFDAGFTKQQVLEVIVGVSLKTLSNYTNALIDTPVDEQFEKSLVTQDARKE